MKKRKGDEKLMEGLDFISKELEEKFKVLKKECADLATNYQPRRKIINGVVFSDEDVVLGNETEYLVVPNIEEKSISDMLMGYFFFWFRNWKNIVWSQDGTKIYVDSGVDPATNENLSVLEVSSSECKSIKELIFRMKMMNLYPEKYLTEFRNNFFKSKFFIDEFPKTHAPILPVFQILYGHMDWFVVKRRLNPAGDKGLGEHVNIQVKNHRQLIEKIRGCCLIVFPSFPVNKIFHEFLMSLLVLTGSGWIGQSNLLGDKTKYLISPTLEILKRIKCLDRMPLNELFVKLLEMKDYAGPNIRMELVSYSDSNISDKSIRLKFGSIMLFLKSWEFDLLDGLRKNLDFPKKLTLYDLCSNFYRENIIYREDLFYNEMISVLLNFDFQTRYPTIFGEKNLIEHQRFFLNHIKDCLARTADLNAFFEENHNCAPLTWPSETIEILSEWEETLNNLEKDFLLEDSLDWVAVMKKIAQKLKCHPLEINEKLDDKKLAKKAMRVDFCYRIIDSEGQKIKKSDLWPPPNRRAFVRQKIFELLKLFKKIPKLRETAILLNYVIGQRFDGLWQIEDKEELHDAIYIDSEDEYLLFKKIFASKLIHPLLKKYVKLRHRGDKYRIMILLPLP